MNTNATYTATDAEGDTYTAEVTKGGANFKVAFSLVGEGLIDERIFTGPNAEAAAHAYAEGLVKQ